MTEPKLADDEGRLAALGRLQILETPPEQPFEKIVTLVRTVLAVPIATVSLVDRDRQWFKAQRGLEVQETARSISICTYTIQQAEPLIIEDTHLDARFAENPLVQGGPRIRSYAGVPLRTSEGYNVGSLCAMDTKPRRFSPADIAILSNFANIVSDEMELRLIASTDFLTGALSRRGFEEQLGREIARHRRYHRPSSLAILDIDHFKTINDSFGHPAGDDVLRQMGQLISKVLRPSDVYGRLGGEEFGVLLPETGAADAFVAAERLREAIQNHRFEMPGGPAIEHAPRYCSALSALGPMLSAANGNAGRSFSPPPRMSEVGRYPERRRWHRRRPKSDVPHESAMATLSPARGTVECVDARSGS